MMMEKQKRDIEEKLSDKINEVKTEVKGAVKTVSDRQDAMEAEQAKMKSDIGQLVTKVEELKKIAEDPASQQQVQPHPEHHHQKPVNRTYSGVVSDLARPILSEYLPSDQSDKQKALDLLDLGRRTVSLYPFQPKDCELEMKRGAKDQDEAKLWAVQTYLRFEMNIKSHILATFTIEDIFSLTEVYDTIYVTFSSVTEANTVFSYTRNMRKEAKVGIYVPKEWQGRFRALNSIAYSLRNPTCEQLKYSTRIKWGHDDLLLYKKDPGTKYWTAVNTSTALPAVDLSAVAQPRMSPAPGRQGRESSKRERSGSPESDSNPSQRVRSIRPRAGSGELDDQGLLQDQEQEVRTLQDPGKVIHEESYCPASPAPIKKNLQQTTTSDLQSPIFKRVQSSALRMNPLL